MAPKDLDKLINKYLQGKCNKKESDFINAWYSSLGQSREQAHEELIAHIQMSNAEDRMREHLSKHTRKRSADTDRPTKPSRLFWSYTAVAASFVLCIAVVLYFVKNDFIGEHQVQPEAVEKFTIIENTSLEKKRFVLPDGSILQISPDSKIRFLNDPSSKSRELYLEGEAYFDVARDINRPFYVYVGNVVTQVLGTTFIVKALPANETVTVTVKTGKVTVYSKITSHKKTVLSPNQQAVYDRTTDMVSTHEASSGEVKGNLLQHTNEMRFDETPIREVLALLEKIYNIDIDFNEDALSGCVLTSTFTEEGFYDRIDVICTAIGASYKIEDSKIIIESNGCKI